MRQLPEFVLTLGVDASGKTSFITKLSEALGYVVLEQTSSEASRAFKREHLGIPLDAEFIEKRRVFYRNLNADFDTTVRQELKHHRVITTGNSLVTEISHAVMGKIVGDTDYSIERIADEWRTDNPVLPDQIVFTHAPIEIIRSRIQTRLASGNTVEQMIGFNSLFFLGHYQEALSSATEFLGQQIPVMSGDTSVISIEDGIDLFTLQV